MATKTEDAPALEGFTLDEYEPAVETVGKYDAHITAILGRDADLEQRDPEAWANGKRTRGHILVPTGDPKVNEETGETEYPDVATERRRFQESARLRDRTARSVGEQKQGDGYTRLSFILIPKQNRPRKPADAAETQEVDEEV